MQSFLHNQQNNLEFKRNKLVNKLQTAGLTVFCIFLLLLKVSVIKCFLLEFFILFNTISGSASNFPSLGQYFQFLKQVLKLKSLDWKWVHWGMRGSTFAKLATNCMKNNKANTIVVNKRLPGESMRSKAQQANFFVHPPSSLETTLKILCNIKLN